MGSSSLLEEEDEQPEETPQSSSVWRRLRSKLGGGTSLLPRILGGQRQRRLMARALLFCSFLLVGHLVTAGRAYATSSSSVGLLLRTVGAAPASGTAAAASSTAAASAAPATLAATALSLRVPILIFSAATGVFVVKKLSAGGATAEEDQEEAVLQASAEPVEVRTSSPAERLQQEEDLLKSVEKMERETRAAVASIEKDVGSELKRLREEKEAKAQSLLEQQNLRKGEGDGGAGATTLLEKIERLQNTAIHLDEKSLAGEDGFPSPTKEEAAASKATTAAAAQGTTDQEEVPLTEEELKRAERDIAVFKLEEEAATVIESPEQDDAVSTGRKEPELTINDKATQVVKATKETTIASTESPAKVNLGSEAGKDAAEAQQSRGASEEADEGDSEEEQADDEVTPPPPSKGGALVALSREELAERSYTVAAGVLLGAVTLALLATKPL